MPDREPQHTDDGHFVVIAGRRWRATDPSIPDAFRAELVAELGAARRAVRSNAPHARQRVNDAKVALGERGDPWWDPTPSGQRTRLAATMQSLLRHRSQEATICPSDAARAAGGRSWRSLMKASRSVAAELASDGVIVVRQRGEPIDLADAVGPVRLGRGPKFTV